MGKREGGKKGSYFVQRSQDVYGDLWIGELREESDIQYCCSMGCLVWGVVVRDEQES